MWRSAYAQLLISGDDPRGVRIASPTKKPDSDDEESAGRNCPSDKPEDHPDQAIDVGVKRLLGENAAVLVD